MLYLKIIDTEYALNYIITNKFIVDEKKEGLGKEWSWYGWRSELATKRENATGLVHIRVATKL